MTDWLFKLLEKIIASKETIKTLAIIFVTSTISIQYSAIKSSIKSYSERDNKEKIENAEFRIKVIEFMEASKITEEEAAYSRAITLNYISDLSVTMEATTKNNILIRKELSKTSPNYPLVTRYEEENNKFMTENLPHYKMETDSIAIKRGIIGYRRIKKP